MTTTLTPLEAGLTGRPAATVRRPGVRVPGWVRVLLRVPLLGKLAGANALVLVAMLALLLPHRAAASRETAGVIVVALSASLLVDLLLVSVALRPVRALAAVAARVTGGDLHARLAPSLVADVEMTCVAETFNALLERLTEERARARRLAAHVITAGEEERGRIARELHDSTAQTLAALALHAGTGLRSRCDPDQAARLELIRDLAAQAVEEVRLLSQAVHSSVLDDLGLPAALERIARRAREQTGVDTVVQTDAGAAALPRPLASVFYFVAREAVRNAVRHAAPRRLVISVATGGGLARLEVTDDGRGFAVGGPAADGGGLFGMRERVALMDGTFGIDSAPGRGTRVVAVVPLGPLGFPQGATGRRAARDGQPGGNHER